MPGLTPINKALSLIPKRADQSQVEQLRQTFVDSGVSVALEAIDHQVLYGRRGTGKTHALRFLEAERRSRSDLAIYVDLRTVGSADGLFNTSEASPVDRASRLLTDLLTQFHESVLVETIQDETLIVDSIFVKRLDALVEAITTVRVDGAVERLTEGEDKATTRSESGFAARVATTPALEARASGETGSESRRLIREVRKGADAAKPVLQRHRSGAERSGIGLVRATYLATPG